MLGLRRVPAGLLMLALLVGACSSGDDPSAGVPAVPPETTSDGVPGTGSPSAPSPPTTAAGPTTNADDDAGEPNATTPPTAPPRPSRCASGQAPTADEPVEIIVWHALGGDAVEFFQLLVTRFESEVPGIQVNLERVATGYPGAIFELADADEADLPDVLMGSSETARLQVDSDRFVSIAECVDGGTHENFTDLLPVVDRMYRVDGELWSAPFNVSTPVALFDKKRWDRAGLDPDDPPTTFDEMYAAIRQLVDSGEVSTGMVMYDRSARWLVEQEASKSDRLLVEPSNGYDQAAAAATFVSPVAVDVLAEMSALRREGYVDWIGLNPAGQDDLLALVNAIDPTGLTLNTSAVLGDVARLLDAGLLPEVEIGVGPMPGPAAGATAGGGSWWLLDSRDARRITAGWLFVEWMSSPEIVAELAAYTGYVPTTARAAASDVVQARWAELPAFRVAYDQLVATPDSEAGAGMQVGPQTEVFRALEIAASTAIDAGSDPRSELERAEEQAEEILAIYEATRPTG